MTHDDVIGEYRQAIAQADALHGYDPIAQRQREKEAERQERRQQEVRKIRPDGGGTRAAAVRGAAILP